MSDLHKIHLTLTKNHVRKMVKGKPFQVSAAGLQGDKHHIKVNHELAKKIQKAKRLHKGVNGFIKS